MRQVLLRWLLLAGCVLGLAIAPFSGALAAATPEMPCHSGHADPDQKDKAHGCCASAGLCHCAMTALPAALGRTAGATASLWIEAPPQPRFSNVFAPAQPPPRT